MVEGGIVGTAFAPLGDRRFRRLFLAETISRFGDRLVGVALAFAVLDLTHSATDLAFVLLAQSLPEALLIYVGGVWADRLPRRGLIVFSYLVGFGCYGAMAGLLLARQALLWQLLVLVAVRSVANAFSTPSHIGLVPETVEAARLQQANGLLQLSTNLCSVFGPATAGVIVATTNPGWALAADAATFIPSTVLLLAIGPLGSVHRPPSRLWDDFFEGVREVRERRWLLGAIFSGALYSFAAIPAMSILGPLVAKQSLGGAASWSAIVAAWGIGTAAGSIISLRYRPERPLATCFAFGLITGGPTLLLLAAAAPTAAIATAELLSGTASGLFFSLEATLLQQYVPGRALSRVSALHQGTWRVVAPLGLASIGALDVAVGPTRTLIAAAAAAFASSALPLAMGDVRRLRWREQREVVAEAIAG